VEWVNDASELPTHTVADAGKPLTVNAAGGATEWGTKVRLLEIDAPPVTGAVGNSVTISASNAEGGDFVGGDVKINLGHPAGIEEKRSSLIISQYPEGYQPKIENQNKVAAVTINCGWQGNKQNVRSAIHVNGGNWHASQGNGTGITFGIKEGSTRTAARIYAEFDVGNSHMSRLVFQTTKDDGTGFSTGAVLWMNGSFTVGYNPVGVYHNTWAGANSIWALGAVGTDAGFAPPSLADTAAANNRIYFSTTANKLVFKDSAGVVHPLYS
jgi:hypothetical protein